MTTALMSLVFRFNDTLARLIDALADPARRRRAALVFVAGYGPLWLIYGLIAKSSPNASATASCAAARAACTAAGSLWLAEAASAATSEIPGTRKPLCDGCVLAKNALQRATAMKEPQRVFFPDDVENLPLRCIRRHQPEQVGEEGILSD